MRVMICLSQGGLRSLSVSSLSYHYEIIVQFLNYRSIQVFFYFLYHVINF